MIDPDQDEIDEALRHARAPGALLGGRIVRVALRQLAAMSKRKRLGNEARATAVESVLKDVSARLKAKGIPAGDVEEALAWGRRDYARYFGSTVEANDDAARAP